MVNEIGKILKVTKKTTQVDRDSIFVYSKNKIEVQYKYFPIQ
jgi:hypothetical protein